MSFFVRLTQVRIGAALLLCPGLGLGWFAARAHAADSLPQARVVIVQNTNATCNFETCAPAVRTMVESAVQRLSGRNPASMAWRFLLWTNGPANPQEVIGIKVFSSPGPQSGTRPAVVAAVIEGLLAAGIPTNHIIIWDKQSLDLRLAGFYELAEHYHVRVAASAQAGYDEKTFYDTSLIGNLVWGDFEFGRRGPGIGRKSFVSKLVSQQMTRIILVTPMMNHNQVGIIGSLYSLSLGSVDNVGRFEGDTSRLATAVPEIYALPALSDRVMLCIIDGLICQYEGSEQGLLHYTAQLNQLRFSHDPVALDILSLQELENQRRLNKAPGVQTSMDLYTNATLLELGVGDPARIRVETLTQDH